MPKLTIGIDESAALGRQLGKRVARFLLPIRQRGRGVGAESGAVEAPTDAMRSEAGARHSDNETADSVAEPPTTKPSVLMVRKQLRRSDVDVALAAPKLATILGVAHTASAEQNAGARRSGGK
jgi:hypothetical protein